MKIPTLQGMRGILVMTAAAALALSSACNRTDEEAEGAAVRGNEKVEDSPVIDGTWRSDIITVVIGDGKMEAFDGGEPMDYPVGEFTIVEPSRGEIKRPNGEVEKFYFEREGDQLILVFQKAGPITLQLEK